MMGRQLQGAKHNKDLRKVVENILAGYDAPAGGDSEILALSSSLQS